MFEFILDASIFKAKEFVAEESSLCVKASELSHFLDQEKALAKKIGERKKKFREDNEYSVEMTNERLEEECKISVETMRKTIIGTTKCTRNFLYKFCVGLHMSVEEANQYFALCGGSLNEDYMADYICIKALEREASIEEFIGAFEKNVGIKISIRSR